MGGNADIVASVSSDIIYAQVPCSSCRCALAWFPARRSQGERGWRDEPEGDQMSEAYFADSPPMNYGKEP